jgi:hypothetical protein
MNPWMPHLPVWYSAKFWVAHLDERVLAQVNSNRVGSV